jgi:hypothetical protein
MAFFNAHVFKSPFLSVFRLRALLVAATFFSLFHLGELKSIAVKSTQSIDKFTQSQAHMSLPEIKKAIATHYKTKPYQKLIDSMLAAEEKYKNDYYVFYHGADSVWRLPQDLYLKLYTYFNPIRMSGVKDFIFLRFEDVHGPTLVQEFLMNELKKQGLINDHGQIGAFLLSANLALFGNVGTPSECTWQYFIKSRGHKSPNREIYEKMFNKFGLDKQYIAEVMSLVKLYQTKEEMLLQIFIPKELVDKIGYLAWVRGIPAHDETIQWVKRGVKDKLYQKTQQALDDLTRVFKQEQVNNPLFEDMMDHIRAGDFKLNEFLHVYRNTPEKIKYINDVMARLIITTDVLLNPRSGVKMFRYSTVTSHQLQTYLQALDKIFVKIISNNN